MSQRNAGAAGPPEGEPGEPPPQEAERSDRRRIAVVLVLAAALAGLSFGLFVVGPQSASGVGPSVLQYTVLTGNVALLFALAFYLLRYLVRLFAARRAGIVGSRFKFKLVMTFIALCLVPALVLYVAAILAMFEAVDRSFAPDVEAMLLDAQAVAAQFTDDARAGLASDVQELGAGLARGPLVVPQHEAELVSALAAELRARRLSAARLYFRGGAAPLDVDDEAGGGRRSPLDPGVLPPAEFERDLARAFGGERFSRTAWSEGSLYVIAGTAVSVPGQAEPAGVVVAARRIPADLARRVDRLREAAAEHQRQREARPFLKIEQALLFLGFSLLIILGATWVALTVARSITVPIQRLAEGTQQVRQGNLGHVVQWEGQDELGLLVGAFNQMSRDLAVQAAEVARKTEELESANAALHRANAELDRQGLERERLLQTMTAGVLALDPAGRVRVANRAAHQILEIPDGGEAGRHVAELLAGESLAELRAEIERALGRDGLRRSRDLALALGRGPVHLQVVLTSQPEATGEGVGLLVLLEDVTELVRAQKLATWETVARRIAHEIKNPLTPIQLSAQRILKKFREGRDELGEVLESGIETIIAEVGGLKQMVDEFSRFARMPEVQPVPGDLNATLQSVAELYRGHEKLSLELDLEPSLPPVPFDPEQLRRALVNLLDNAVEATGRRGRILVRSELAAGKRHARVSIADDGPGVPPTDRDKLFLPYFTTKRRGTGLGLAIVHRIVIDHHGRVRVEENLPRGARFVIELPLPAAGAAAGAGGRAG